MASRSWPDQLIGLGVHGCRGYSLSIRGGIIHHLHPPLNEGISRDPRFDPHENADVTVGE